MILLDLITAQLTNDIALSSFARSPAQKQKHTFFVPVEEQHVGREDVGEEDNIDYGQGGQTQAQSQEDPQTIQAILNQTLFPTQPTTEEESKALFSVTKEIFRVGLTCDHIDIYTVI